MPQSPAIENRSGPRYVHAFPIRAEWDTKDGVHIIAEGETVTARWSCKGTHKGDLSGIAPTGKQFTISGISIARFTNGKMVEGWVNWDALGLMQQLGVIAEVGKSKAVAR